MAVAALSTAGFTQYVNASTKSAPPSSLAGAEAAVAQTVEWVDDLLNLTSSANSVPATPADPTTAILDAAYGLNTTSSSDNPFEDILTNAYGTSSTSGSSGSASSATASEPAPAAAPTPATSGNDGSSASVNAYA
jgi:hypothetical protein